MMNKYLLLLMIFFILQSCQNACDELNESIKTSLIDGEISADEISVMKAIILGNKKEIGKCNNALISSSGDILGDELIRIIKKTKEYRKQSKSGEVKIDFSGGNKPSLSKNEIVPKLYLERSGSMVFYDNPDGNGEFRNVLTSLLTNFNSITNKKNIIYVVNDDVYDCPLDFKGLVQSKNIFAATNNIGNATFTDFDLIFRRILGDLKQGDVSILFSDLIYSTPSMQDVSNTKILDGAQKLTLNVFQGFSKDISVLVLKFNGGYKGKYYPHNQSPKYYNGPRPYYVCLFAKNETMNTFMDDDKYAKIRAWSNYTNFENFYFFSNDDKVRNPFYTIRLKDPDKAGHYDQDSEEKKTHEQWVHSIEDIKHDRDGKLSINLIVDLSNMHLPKEIKVDKNNYVVEANTNQTFKIDKIIEVNDNEEGTHKITLSTEIKRGGTRSITLKFKNPFPAKWIINSQSENDSDVESGDFPSKTFGIKNMMEGIHLAFDKDQSEYIYSLKINLKN